MSLLAGIDRRDVALTAVAVALGQVDALAPGLYGTSVVGPRWVVSVDLPGGGAVACCSGAPGPGLAFAVGIGALAVQALTVGTSEGNGVALPGAGAELLGGGATGPGGWPSRPSCAIPVVCRDPRGLQPGEHHGRRGASTASAGTSRSSPPGCSAPTSGPAASSWPSSGSGPRDSAEAAAAAERARVARELHDVLAHSLGVVVVQAEAAEEALARRPEVAAESLRVDPADRPRGAGGGTPAGRRPPRGRGAAGAGARAPRRSGSWCTGSSAAGLPGRARGARARSTGCRRRPTSRSTGSSRSR